MHGFPGVFGKQREVKPYTNTTATATTINPNATVGVYTTTPVQLVASTAFDVTMVRITAIAATATGLIWSAGSEPAESTSTRFPASARRYPAAICERPALCTQTKRTVGVAWSGIVLNLPETVARK